MKIKVSLSAVPKYTEDQQDVLMGLVHDKSNIIPTSGSDDDLDELIKKYSDAPKVPLYRGIYQQELSRITEQMEDQGYVRLNRYLSMTEDKNLAKKFAETRVILELMPTGTATKRKGFNYHDRLEKYILSIPLEEAFSGDSEWRDGLIDMVRKEKEWIYPVGYKFKVSGTRKEGSLTIMTIQPV